MQRFTPFAVIILALAAGFFSLFGSDSYSAYLSLQESLEGQKEENVELRDRVSHLRKQVIGLEKDDRTLEKAARNELNFARHGELIFIFDQYVDGE